MANPSAKSGDACCSALSAVLGADDYEPCFTVDDDGVLCLTVGITDIEEDEPTLVLEPIIFCPFCGTRLQSADGGETAIPGAA
ncbi:MAG: hypothetical protein AB7L90_15230 [Hyphomicrobiaceae bacterium]